MFKRIVNVVEVLAVVAAAVFVLLLFTNEPDSGGGGGAQAAPGAALYAQNCARCHGSDGGGGLGPQLSDGQAKKDFPDEADQVAFVTKGQGGMPAFGGSLSPEEIQQVVAYTRTL
jgi:mono/diheme cytochrome c family protein